MGDCMLAFQCAQALRTKQPHIHIDVALSTRLEIYQAICSLISNSRYLPIKLSENLSSNHEIELNWEAETQKIQKEIGEYDEIYYVIPDLLFRNPHSFDYKKYNLHPQIIKQQRVFLYENNIQENRIYCGLQTTTSGYLYSQIKELINDLSIKLPYYEIYFPNINSWNNEKCFDLSGEFKSNTIIDKNCSLISSLSYLKQSKYFIGTCNGPSHIAYHLGIPRLILDPQYDKAPWVARWKEDYSECIDIRMPYNYVSQLVYNNITQIETNLIPRNMALYNSNNGKTWKDNLFLKY